MSFIPDPGGGGGWSRNSSDPEEIVLNCSDHKKRKFIHKLLRFRQKKFDPFRLLREISELQYTLKALFGLVCSGPRDLSLSRSGPEQIF